MKRKLYLAVALLSLVGVTACDEVISSKSSFGSSIDYNVDPFSETEIPADDYTYHQWTNIGSIYTFLSDPDGHFRVAEFKTQQALHGFTDETPGDDGYYHFYLGLFLARDELEKTFPDTGIYKYEPNAQCDLIKVRDIGMYLMYSHEYFYSETARAVKQVVKTFESIDINNPEEMINKKILGLSLTRDGELRINDPYPPTKNIKKVEPSLRTTYYKVPDGVEVTFNGPSD